MYSKEMKFTLSNIVNILSDIYDLIEDDPRAVRNYKNVERIVNRFLSKWDSVLTLRKWMKDPELFGTDLISTYRKLENQVPEFGTEYEDLLEELLEEVLRFLKIPEKNYFLVD